MHVWSHGCSLSCWLQEWELCFKWRLLSFWMLVECLQTDRTLMQVSQQSNCAEERQQARSTKLSRTSSLPDLQNSLNTIFNWHSGMSIRLCVWRHKHMLWRRRHCSYISCCALVHSLNLAFSRLISSGPLTCPNIGSNLELTQLWPAKSTSRSAGVHLLRTTWVFL